MKYNFENFKNVILLILIIMLLYYLIIYYNSIDNNNNKNNKLINYKLKERMSDDIFGNVSYEYSSGLLEKKINKKINKNFDNFKVEIIDNNEDVENTFKIFNNIEHVGIIKYFPFELTDNKSWLKCDGRKHPAVFYPDLFKLLVSNREPNNTDEIQVPNLIGKIIFGMREKINARSGLADLTIKDINYHSSNPGKSMNKENTANYNDKIAIHGVEEIGYMIGDRDGNDICPSKDIYSVEEDGSLTVCVLNSNYPPFISLYPYIKAKNLNYKIRIPTLDL